MTTKIANQLRLTAYGAAKEVGRSAFIIEDNKHRILIDAGIKIQPGDELSLAPVGLKKRASELTAAVLSHAHVDHSAYFPMLWENGYYGKLYMTKPTRDIVQLLWQDHLKIEKERHWSHFALERASENIVGLEYRERYNITDGISIEFFNSGHILGGAMILIDWEGFKILYTGDINNAITPLFDGIDIPDTEIDVLITETTNGLRKIKPRKDVNRQLLDRVKQNLRNGNKVIIPAFSIGRSQEVLTVLTSEIRDFPIYVDGMINKMNDITERYLTPKWVSEPILKRLKKEKVFSPFRYDNVVPIRYETVENPVEFRKFVSKSDEPCIIVTTSGMMEPSPLHYYLKYLGDKKDVLLGITGYQAEGTTGRQVLEGASEITIVPGFKAKPTKIQLKVDVIRFGFSGHSSSDGVLDIVEQTKPDQVYLIHGDYQEQQDLASILPKELEPVSLDLKQSVVLANASNFPIPAVQTLE